MTPTYKPGVWRAGTVTQVLPEAMGLRSYTFLFDTPVKHQAGQHYELRLTAEDGYQAARLYSAAMPANGTSNMLQLTVALMDYGEISPYLFNFVKIGSQIEVRGPFGRHFVWSPKLTRPVLLIGGGTGVIPLRAMRLQHQYAHSKAPLQLLYSVRTYYDMPYKYELFPSKGQPPEDVILTFTEEAPTGWDGYARRIDKHMLQEVLKYYDADPLIYICGPTPFVEATANLLVDVGQDPAQIKAERFGPTASA
jgi:ferredoxin-NADP reductase